MKVDKNKPSVEKTCGNSDILVSFDKIIPQNQKTEILNSHHHSLDVLGLIKTGHHEKAYKIVRDAFFQQHLAEWEADGTKIHDKDKEGLFRVAFTDLKDNLLACDDSQAIPDELKNVGLYLKNRGEALKLKVQHKSRKSLAYQTILAIQNGEDRDMRKVYHMHRDYFIGYSRRKFPGFDIAELADTFQDALIVLIQDYVRTQRFRVVGDWVVGLKGTTGVKTFIVSIGYRMLARKSGAPTMTDLPDHIEQELIQVDEDDFGLEDEALRSAISKLPLKSKRLLFYRYWLKLSRIQIAEIMDSTPVAIGVRLFNCRKRLRDDLNF